VEANYQELNETSCGLQTSSARPRQSDRTLIRSDRSLYMPTDDLYYLSTFGDARRHNDNARTEHFHNTTIIVSMQS
jgi:hypothetical protein